MCEEVFTNGFESKCHYILGGIKVPINPVSRSSILGSIPGPILFGVIIDSTCLQWQETCGERGACWLYNNKSLSWKLTTLSLVCNLLTVLFYALALRFYEPASHGDSSRDNRDAPTT